MRINPQHCQSLDSFLDDDAPGEEYLDKLIEFTKGVFLNKKGIPPIFIYEKDGDVQPVKVPPSLIDSEEGKDELSAMISNVVSSFKPDSHCFVCEAWMYKMEDFDSKEEAMTAFADFKKGIPSDKIVRVEGVTFAYTKINSDNEQERWLGSMLFSRDADDRISSFDSVKWIKADGEKKLEGRLFG
jgi:hypothetical protein